jgi:hypothetical protein
MVEKAEYAMSFKLRNDLKKLTGACLCHVEKKDD